MNFSKAFILVLLALILSLLDTSYFSFLPVFGATILLTFVIALNLAVLSSWKILLAYAIPSVFFYSIFSSLPIWLVVIAFLGIPAGAFFFRKKYFPESYAFLSIIFFILGTLIFILLLLANGREWNVNSAVVAIYFVIINSAAGAVVYYLIQKYRKSFSRREIKF